MAIKIGTSGGYSAAETTAMVLTNSSQETALFSQTLPGGAMGSNKELKFRIICRITTGVLPPSLTIKIKLGTSVLTLLSSVVLAGSVSNKPFIIEGSIINNSEMSQIIFAKISQNTSGLQILSNPTPMENTDWTEDTTVDKVFSVTATFSAASALSTLTFKHAMIELT